MQPMKRNSDISGLEQSAALLAVNRLIAPGKAFRSRHLLVGTMSSLSSVVCRHPFQMVVTEKGTRKGNLSGADFLYVNELGQASEPSR